MWGVFMQRPLQTRPSPHHTHTAFKAPDKSTLRGFSGGICGQGPWGREGGAGRQPSLYSTAALNPSRQALQLMCRPAQMWEKALGLLRSLRRDGSWQ